MKFLRKIVYLKHRGAVLIISMIFVLIFSALAVSLATLSGTNVQLASNQHKVNCAFASAESGLEVMRYWLSRVTIPASTSPSNYLSTMTTALQNDLADNSISNISLSYDGSTITLPSVTLASADDMSFEAVIQQLDDNTVQMDVTGRNDQMTRTIRVNYDIGPRQQPIFDFGLATKGPLQIDGNPTMRGVNSPDEADIYIESANDNTALHIAGNTNFDGNISIGNENANVDFEGDILIGGEHGQEAIDNHVSTGVALSEFPVPDTGHFSKYATGDIINSSTDTSDNMTLANRKVLAGADPIFEGNVIIKGILFIEQSNAVTFNGNVSLRGIMVADGDVDEPGTDRITFLGNFETRPYPAGSDFDEIRSETGSSLLAPGFSANFAGNFASLGGVMAVSGAYFSGNVDAQVEGTMMSYSDSPLVIEGNPTLRFDRSDDIETPAGFESTKVLEFQFQPSSYSESPL